MQHSRYVLTLHSRYHRLPKVLWDYIWTYDDRYKVEFKSCVYELNNYFLYNRIVDRIKADIQIYAIYLYMNTTRNPVCNNLYDFHKYVFIKKQQFGDGIHNDELKPYLLKPSNKNNQELVSS